MNRSKYILDDISRKRGIFTLHINGVCIICIDLNDVQFLKKMFFLAYL